MRPPAHPRRRGPTGRRAATTAISAAACATPLSAATNRQGDVPSARGGEVRPHRLDEDRRDRVAGRDADDAPLDADDERGEARDEPQRREPEQPVRAAEREEHLAAERLERLDEPDQREDLDDRGRIAPLRPEDDLDEVRRDDRRGRRAPGSRSAPTRRVARIQMSAIRGRSSLMREKAGKKTCWSGPAMRENGTRTMFVASAYSAERRRHRGSARSAGCRRSGPPGRGGSRRRRCPRSRRAAAGSRTRTIADGHHSARYQSSTVDTAASTRSCATIAHAPKPASATAMPTAAPTTVAAI